MANPKRFNAKAILICLLVCLAAAGIFLIGILSQPLAGVDGRQSAPSSAQPSERQADTSASVTSSASPSELPVQTPDNSVHLSVWVAYWDWENGLNDLNSIAEMPESVHAFAASFNDRDKLVFPEEMLGMLTDLDGISSAHPEMPIYLTLVNDVQVPDGKWTEKDSKLLDRLMQSEDSRAEHIGEIIHITQQNGFDGVEIDYEKISDETWSNFALFCTELYTELTAKGIPLRVVLEPGSPIEQGGLPEGPEYVMMAYNLYGTGIEPGPKADYAFIRRLADEMRMLPGEKCIAFATGGYEWDSEGKARQLNESDAYNLSQQSGDLKRDESSGALYFTYQAEDGIHTVWYADDETLAGWINLSKSLGYRHVALWRLGGCRLESLQMLGALNAADGNKVD